MPTVISYNAAISARLWEGRSAASVLTLLLSCACRGGSESRQRGEMRQVKFDPNVISYSAAVSAGEKGGQ